MGRCSWLSRLEARVDRQAGWMTQGDKARRLAALRQQIRAMEGGGGAAGVLPLGVAAVDRWLPQGGLALAAVHEIADATLGRPGDAADDAPDGGPEDGAATGFAAVLAGRAAGPVVWVSATTDLYPPGLVAFGLPPHRLVCVVSGRPKNRLWAMEEAARSGAIVVGETAALAPVAARRLQLAAEAGRAPVFLLGRSLMAARSSGTSTQALPAATRWRVAARPCRGPAPTAEWHGVGDSVWGLDLVRCRGGRPGRWVVKWQGAAAGFAEVNVAAGAPNQGGAGDIAIRRAGNLKIAI